MIGSDESLSLNHDDVRFHTLTKDAYIPTNGSSHQALIVPIEKVVQQTREMLFIDCVW